MVTPFAPLSAMPFPVFPMWALTLPRRVTTPFHDTRDPIRAMITTCTASVRGWSLSACGWRVPLLLMRVRIEKALSVRRF